MLTLRWAKGRMMTVDGAQGSGEVVMMISKLELRSFRHLLGFLMGSLAIRHQAINSPGGLGHALAVEPFKRTFWTQSAWVDNKALQQFNKAEPHKGIVSEFSPRMVDSVFSFFRQDVAAQLSWDTVRVRLATVAEERAAKAAKRAPGQPSH